MAKMMLGMYVVIGQERQVRVATWRSLKSMKLMASARFSSSLTVRLSVRVLELYLGVLDLRSNKGSKDAAKLD